VSGLSGRVRGRVRRATLRAEQGNGG